MRISLPNPTRFSKIFESALGKPLNIELTGIATDSREVQKGDLYIAISGDRVDGHLFLKEVFDKGAGAALVSESFSQIEGLQILVDDTISAISKVSTLWREQFDFPIIGITGSKGKTSTKELLKPVSYKHLRAHETDRNLE